MYLRDADPAGANYLVFRDTTAGGQPTVWQFRAISEKLGPAEAAKDVEKFLADKPGNKVVNAREIQGDRFTAPGPYGIDLEFYVARPAGTPRHTFRFGGMRESIPEYCDYLHLQLPADGSYFVAIFPRARAEEAPTFTKLADGKVIKVTGKFGTDYAILSQEPADAKADGASFQGTAGCVQDRAAGLSLAVLAPGTVAYNDYSLTAPMAASMRVEKDALSLDFPADHQGGEVVLSAPGKWKADALAGVEIKTNEKKQLVLTVSAGANLVRLVRE